MNIAASPRSILDYLDKLDHIKGAKYFCPVCGGNDLSINHNTGAFTCYNNGCDGTKILDAIAPRTKEQRAAYFREKHRTKTPKEIEIERNKQATSNTWAVEQKAIELANDFDPPLISQARLENEISEWARAHKHDPFTAKALLREAIQKLSSSESSGAADKANLVVLPVAPKLPISELKTKVKELAETLVAESDLKTEILILADRSGRTSKEVWDLYSTAVSELEQAGSRDDRTAEVDKLLKMSAYQPKLKQFLDPILAKPLEAIAQYLSINEVSMLSTLLPVGASLCPVGTRLELIEETDFYALPILYTGVVAESGSGKSPTQKILMKPLFKLQEQAEQDHKLAIEHYEEEVKQWAKSGKENGEPKPEAPKVREYYMIDVTREAVAKIQSEQPDRGFLGYLDELSAIVGGQNQYRNGRGTDREALLSGRDGSPIKVNRASGNRISAPQSAYSITGTTQPGTLKRLMGDMSDESGQWARFLWWLMPLQPAPYPRNAVKHDVDGLLSATYIRLDALKAETYKLSPEAKQLYMDWYDELDALKMAEPKAALRSVYNKMKGDTGVLMLLLHLINHCAVSGAAPDLFISASTAKAAIALSKFCISQVKLIHAMGDEEQGELPPVMAKLIELSNRKGWLDARTAKQSSAKMRSDKQYSADKIRELFQELVAMGYGELRGEGKSLEWKSSKQIGVEAICKDQDFKDHPPEQLTESTPEPQPATEGMHPFRRLIEQWAIDAGLLPEESKALRQRLFGKMSYKNYSSEQMEQLKTAIAAAGREKTGKTEAHQKQEVAAGSLSNTATLEVGGRVKFPTDTGEKAGYVTALTNSEVTIEPDGTDDLITLPIDQVTPLVQKS